MSGPIDAGVIKDLTGMVVTAVDGLPYTGASFAVIRLEDPAGGAEDGFFWDAVAVDWAAGPSPFPCAVVTLFSIASTGGFFAALTGAALTLAAGALRLLGGASGFRTVSQTGQVIGSRSMACASEAVPRADQTAIGVARPSAQGHATSNTAKAASSPRSIPTEAA